MGRRQVGAVDVSNWLMSVPIGSVRQFEPRPETVPETDFPSVAGFQQRQRGLACLAAVKALDAGRKAIESVKAFFFLLMFQSEETITINQFNHSFNSSHIAILSQSRFCLPYWPLCCCAGSLNLD